jgi:signal transduction histidine kinase
MRYENIQLLVLSTAALFVLVIGFIVYFVVLYRNKQLKNKQEQQQLKAHYSQEILRAQIEMQDQTLNYISGEIHDNIAQVLSFVKLSLAMPGNMGETEKQSKIDESRELIAQAITDLRDLSKSLSYEHISSLGLLKTIEIEVKRINKSGLIHVSFSVDGEHYALGSQPELVLFRIFQEALNNVLKYSAAKQLNIRLQYDAELFTLTLEDNGVGFSPRLLESNSGLGIKNIINRAALIGGTATIASSPGQGCRIEVALNPYKQQYYSDGGIYQNRFS